MGWRDKLPLVPNMGTTGEVVPRRRPHIFDRRWKPDDQFPAVRVYTSKIMIPVITIAWIRIRIAIHIRRFAEARPPDRLCNRKTASGFE